MSEKPKIINILIAKGQTPLASYSEHTGEFIQQCETILNEVHENKSASINLNNGYIIYYINENEITFLVMADSLFAQETVIACIESVKKEFQSTYPGRDFDSEREYGLNDEFQNKLKMKYEYFNENEGTTSEVIQKLNTEMNKMKTQIIEAQFSLQERGDNINRTSEKASELLKESESHKSNAIKVRKGESKKKVWLWIGTIFIILLIIYFLVSIACKSFTFQCT
jgi:hypothetical protein